MKAVDLAKVAAAAEAVCLKQQAFRLGKQVAFLVLAGLFGLFALVGFHVVLWTIFDGPWNFGKVGSSLAVFGFDLLIAVILVFLGRSKAPGRAEVEARITRDRSLVELRSAVAIGAIASTVTGPIGRSVVRSVWSLVRGGKSSRRRA